MEICENEKKEMVVLKLELRQVCGFEGSSMWGMNGGQPESPDSKLLVYARKSVLAESKTEIWICDKDTLGNQRKVFTVNCGNHNGPSATFVDNDHIVFRDRMESQWAFRILNVHTGQVKYGPIFGK